MTKSLSEIQIENRKFILEATLQGNNLRLLKENIADFQGAKLTLSRVLLALPNELYYYKSANWLYIAKPNQDPKEQITCDLKKETLEEQTEETQRGLNEFFNN